MQSARSTIGEVDLVVLLLEGCERPGRGDAFIVNLLRQQPLPVMVVLNKWDKVLPNGRSAEGLRGAPGRDGVAAAPAVPWRGMAVVVAQMATLPGRLYPPEMVCDQPERILLGS